MTRDFSYHACLFVCKYTSKTCLFDKIESLKLETREILFFCLDSDAIIVVAICLIIFFIICLNLLQNIILFRFVLKMLCKYDPSLKEISWNSQSEASKQFDWQMFVTWWYCISVNMGWGSLFSSGSLWICNLIIGSSVSCRPFQMPICYPFFFLSK